MIKTVFELNFLSVKPNFRAGVGVGEVRSVTARTGYCILRLTRVHHRPNVLLQLVTLPRAGAGGGRGGGGGGGGGGGQGLLQLGRHLRHLPRSCWNLTVGEIFSIDY